MKSNTRGIVYALLASVIYGIVLLTSKMIIEDGVISEASMLGWRFLFASLLAMIVVIVKRVPARPTARQFTELFLYGVFGTLMVSLLLTRSYRYIDLGLATVCHFFYPIAVSLIMRLVYKERLSDKGQFAVLMTALALVVLIFSTGLQSLKGMVIAVISGIFWAVYLIAFDKALYAEMDQNAAVCWIMGGNAVLFLLMSVLDGTFIIPGMNRIGLIVLSAGMMVGAMLLTVKAISLCGPTMTAFISLFEPITAVVTDMIVYHAFPGIMQTAGYLMMAVAIILITMKDEEAVHDTE